ncbi:MAG: hypothetical protein M0Z31_11235 [Clostridia bacterium]|nr:hypothetical protein [Clostridia bacterium]
MPPFRKISFSFYSKNYESTIKILFDRNQNRLTEIVEIDLGKNSTVKIVREVDNLRAGEKGCPNSI